MQTAPQTQDQQPEQTPGDAQADPGRKPFAAVIQEARNGLLHADLSDKLADVVAGVVEHEKVGTVTLTLTVRPNAAGTVTVTDDVKAKVPEGEKPASLFFADGHGNLSRRDPRQMEMTGPVRDVTPQAPRPVRDVPTRPVPAGVDPGTGEVQPD